jgi:methylaspartate mutase sigma subunit
MTSHTIARPSTPSLIDRPRPIALVGGPSSDAHTWNLVFLGLYLEEHRFTVINLGPCVPDNLFTEEIARAQPDLVVVSTVNGHGILDGSRLIGAIRSDARWSPVVIIGGKLSTLGGDNASAAPILLERGFDGVFDDSAGLTAFESLIMTMHARGHVLR